MCSRKKTKGMPKEPIEAVIKLLSEELRNLISGLPEHLQRSVPKQLKGNRPARMGRSEPLHAGKVSFHQGCSDASFPV
jgi:hypothetical protein